eukprot:168446-Prorocentrum_minimum.AAC.2
MFPEGVTRSAHSPRNPSTQARNCGHSIHFLASSLVWLACLRRDSASWCISRSAFTHPALMLDLCARHNTILH